MTDENPYTTGPSPYDEATLRKLYHDEGLTAAEIADRFDRNRQTIYRWMDDFDIERRRGGSPQVDR